MEKSPTRKLFTFISIIPLYQKIHQKKFLAQIIALQGWKLPKYLQRKKGPNLHPLHSNSCLIFKTPLFGLRLLELKLDSNWNPMQKTKFKSNDGWRRYSSSKIIHLFTSFIVETSLQIQYQSCLDQKNSN